MKTFDFLWDYYTEGAKLRNLTETMLRMGIKENSEVVPVRLSNCKPLPAFTNAFELPTGPVRDFGIQFYRGPIGDNLVDEANLQTFDEFDILVEPHPAFIQAYQVDFAEYAFRIQYPVDFDTEDFIIYYQPIDLDKLTNSLLSQLSVSNSGTATTRKNIRVEKDNYADILLKRSKAQAALGPSDDMYSGEITMSRQAHGRVYGIDLRTGEVTL